MGRVFFGRAGPVVQCGSRGPILEGMWARELETKVCKHKLGLGLGVRGWQARPADPEGSSSGFEIRATGRQKHRLFCLDCVSGMASEWRGGLMGP